MSDVNVENTVEQAAETVEIVDCGQASKVTKGLPFLVFFELSLPPWDRALIL